MDIKILGTDLGKTVCSLAGLDEAGAVVFCKRLQRHRLLGFLDTLSPASLRWTPAASAGDGIDEVMPAHLLEPAIVGAIAADEDRVPRGLHVVVDPETVRNVVPWRLFLRQWGAFLEHDGELAFHRMPFAD